MEALTTVWALVLFLGPLPALLSRRPARALPALVLAAALSSVFLVRSQDAPAATLTVTHTFAAYQGQEMHPKAFVVDHVEAPAWQAPALCLAWAVLWLGFWLLRRRQRNPDPNVGPLLFAWGGSLLILALQKTAAPATLALALQVPALPPFELVLLPAMVAAAVALGRACSQVLGMVLRLVILIALAHLPLAILGTVLTRQEMGTYLDVHTIDFIANPLNRLPTELVAGSNEQLAWLIWVPQLVVWPSFTLMSTGGVGFLVLMLGRQRANG